MVFNLCYIMSPLAAAEHEEAEYERHRAEKRQQTSQQLAYQPPAAVGESHIPSNLCSPHFSVLTQLVESLGL